MSLERVGETIREWREIRGLSQEGLGALADVNADTVWRIETGRRRPRPSTLRKLARALAIPVEELTRPRGKTQTEGFGGVRDAARHSPQRTLDQAKRDLRSALSRYLAAPDDDDARWLAESLQNRYAASLEAAGRSVGEAVAEVGDLYLDTIAQHHAEADTE